MSQPSEHEHGRQDEAMPGPRRSTDCNSRRPSRSSAEYGAPESYRNLDGALAPVRDAGDATTAQQPQRQPSSRSSAREVRNARRASTASRVDYDNPDAYANLDEVIDVSPVQNPDEEPTRRFETLEQVRARDREYTRDQRLEERKASGGEPQPGLEIAAEESGRVEISRLATQIYTVSYLVLFSILGTLARLGLQALTSSYPGEPVIFASLWPNFAGSAVMGFLAEDRMLFRDPLHANRTPEAKQSKGPDQESGGSGESPTAADLAAAKKEHAAIKKTIPLYIGLATGFCGSFTSFSSFIRDMFFALSNELTAPGAGAEAARNGGYSFMAVVAVLLVTVSLSLSGLFIGAHLAIALEPVTPALTSLFTRKIVDRLAVVLGFGSWIGAVLLCIWPPDRGGRGQETWRGTATFALVFAPLGCLCRFYASLWLNGRIVSFPLGTFAVNMAGTAMLGMAWDLAHVPLGGAVGCQVLQGVQDGFCGCLTTVSTWVVELAALRRRHAYVYGGASVAVGLALLVVIMGSLKWTDGYAALLCTH
ncbi:CrcB-like protein-domain-containing protein [Lasiosphaeria miniovina]|uniref:CrcB-like protein-domain-containing protein n=1 Tax=Lasiosphaeria miniovina TaxID=1954250 RepID=A0AA40E4Z8_9PEZI|nr:CrcB-like protein-domain-containing protein [Lasiosphaeria miniovina]KAK0722703.1 CrcB-like protein-domain-containing protein [Lasiosphaeria miniovina]